MYAAAGMIVGGLILELIARLGYLFVKQRAMGEAETYVAAALGAVFGKGILWVLLYGLIASMIIIVPMFLYNQYKMNNKKTCILSILFILSVLIFKLVVQNYFSLAALVIIGVMLSVSIMQGIKQEESRIYLPYVPALAAGALYFLFFSV